MEDNKDKILAVVNGEEIKQSEVDNFIQALGYRGAQFNNEEGRKRLTICKRSQKTIRRIVEGLCDG